jgi:predicted phage terminase large subunit-like protein
LAITPFVSSKSPAPSWPSAPKTTTPDFAHFLKVTSPRAWNLDFAHLQLLRSALESVTRGECKRLMVFLPPRHGKSETTTVRYPVHRIETLRRTRVVIAAYNQTLASKFSRKARRIAQERFPLATDRKAADDWETPEGGGVRAVGVGAGITGHGADLILIDDPIKNREEAESEVYRERVWEWYTDDLYTRLEPGGAIVLIMTRWHELDLAGRILDSEQAGDWRVIRLPALAEEDDELGRPEGAALCPDRYDESALADIRRTQGEYSFQALYQQRPSPREGAFFKVAMLQVVDAAPAGLPTVRAWDKAATENDGDHTAGVLMAGPDANGLYYVLDVVRGQWGPDIRNATILLSSQMDGRAVRVRGSQDPGSAGVDDAKAFVRLLAGFHVTTERATGPKEVRADPLAAQVNAGNVRLLRGPWNRAFVEELRTFPLGRHDDQVDASADAFNALTARRVGRGAGGIG